MRFREVFEFELEQILRGAATWVYALLLFLVAAWMLLATHDGNILFNAPIRLTWMGMAAGMFGLLVTAGLFGAVSVRDVEAEMDPLLYTTPLTKTQYLGGRFLAALCINALLLLAIPLGQLAATLVFRNVEPALVAPLDVRAYLQAFPLFLLPTLLFSSGIFFTVAMLGRTVIPVYIGAILLFISGIVAGNYAGQIDDPMLAALLDPFAIAMLDGLSNTWTPVEQNTRWIGFPAPLLFSRIVLLVLATAALALLHRIFRFGYDDGRGRRRECRSIVLPVAERTGSVAIPRVAGSFERFTWIRQTLAVARRCFGEIVASRAFVAVLLLAFGLTLLWGWNVGSTAFDSPVWPVTQLVATEALSGRNAPIIYLIIALYAGEMVWKDRNVGMAEIADAAPVSEGIALLGRYLAVLATLVLLQLVVMAAGLTIQTLQGYYDFELGLYLRILFGFALVEYALLAALAMTIHVLVNQKYVGHILMVVVFILTIIAPALGIDHHLLVYGGDPGWLYSDMNGFGPFVGPFVWFKLYWAAWALLLAVLASLLWVRGRELGLARRLGAARARFRGATARAAAAATLLVLLFGGFVFYNTNVLHDYRTPNESGAPQALYERRYKRFAGAPQPTIVSAQLRAEIYPDERALDLTGTFHMVNRSGVPVDSVHVYLDPAVDARVLSFDRPSRAVLVDDALGFRIYALERALQPGDALALTFDVAWRARGFPNDGIPTEVVENGTHFNRSWMPAIGYQPLLELTDERERRSFGLPPQPPASRDPAALRYRHPVRNEDRVRVETIIGTTADQIAITPGVLQRSWTENGRRYFHYDTEVPESFGATIISGRYAVREDRWRDVELRIYHHPTHAGNLDRVVRGMKESLAYFTEQFGPLPYRHLNIVEIPPYGDYGSAHPGMIVFSETFFGIRADEGDVDEPFYGTAHEVAHHWWGGQVRSATVPGNGFLSESLANYSAMILTEHVYGSEMARLVYDGQMDRYLRGRAEQSHEVPVLDVGGQPYIAYRKGALAMMILRDHIGEDRVNTALRRFVERQRNAGPPFPTSRDLYTELRTVTPDSLHGLLTDLFETITLWDLRTEQASVEQTASGEYEVTLEVVARKVRADSVGRETEVAMNDLVEIGVFAPGDDGGLGAPLHLERHRIRSGTQTLRITVPRAPAHAGIDPWRKLFDSNRVDNLVEVDPTAADPQP